MHISELSSDKSSHHPDKGHDAGSGNGPVTAIDGGHYYRKKIVVVGLGMVALSFMCVVFPETHNVLIRGNGRAPSLY